MPSPYKTVCFVSGRTCEAGNAAGAGEGDFKCASSSAGMLSLLLPLKYGGGGLLLFMWLSSVRLFATPWTEAHPAPLVLEFSRIEYWSG